MDETVHDFLLPLHDFTIGTTVLFETGHWRCRFNRGSNLFTAGFQL